MYKTAHPKIYLETIIQCQEDFHRWSLFQKKKIKSPKSGIILRGKYILVNTPYPTRGYVHAWPPLKTKIIHCCVRIRISIFNTRNDLFPWTRTSFLTRWNGQLLNFQCRWRTYDVNRSTHRPIICLWTRIVSDESHKNDVNGIQWDVYCLYLFFFNFSK